MDVTVVICTFNRERALHQTLAKMVELTIPACCAWELLVIDNNSSDGTEQSCREFQAVLPLRYIFEGQSGKSNALNRAILEARGRLLLFTDDDVDVSRRWMSEYVSAAERYPDASCFGGKIIAQWESDPPQWLASHSHSILMGMSVQLDLGNCEFPLTDPERAFYGANMAIRSSFFHEQSRFRTDLGLIRGLRVGGEDLALIQSAMEREAGAIYIPSAVVHHRNPKARMTESYLRQWFAGAGVLAVRCGQYPGKRLWFGVPRYLWKRLVISGIGFALSRWIAPSRIWVPLEAEMARMWGAISELRKQCRAHRV